MNLPTSCPSCGAAVVDAFCWNCGKGIPEIKPGAAPMTSDEIRALVEDQRYSHTPYVGTLIAVIETMLAREAEVLKWLQDNCTLPAKVGYGGGAKVVNGNEVIDAVTAILNPERKT